MSRQQPKQTRIRLGKACIAFYVLMAVSTAVGQGSNPPTESAGDLVRSVVANGSGRAQMPSMKHMFRARKETPRGSQTKLYVETSQAMAGMTVAVNDHPLALNRSRQSRTSRCVDQQSSTATPETSTREGKTKSGRCAAS